jgi:hypothetical protein
LEIVENRFVMGDMVKLLVLRPKDKVTVGAVTTKATTPA